MESIQTIKTANEELCLLCRLALNGDHNASGQPVHEKCQKEYAKRMLAHIQKNKGLCQVCGFRTNDPLSVCRKCQESMV